jgi:SAM-dependent methyltransferase
MSEERPLPHRSLDRCLSCGNTRLARLPLRYEFRGSYPLVECAACGLRFLAVQPAGAGLAELYGASYFERDFRCGRSAGDSFREEAFRDENRGLLDQFASLRAPGRLLEVGSAGGWLLKHAAERGWEAQGVELSGAAVAQARTLGVTVFHGELAAARLPGSFFDLVYMGDGLEHVPDCRATLDEVVRVLKPAGHLYLRGPLTTNSLARRLALAAYRLAGREIVLREPPYHLWEFRPGSLTRLFAAAGLGVVRLRQSKIPPGQPHGEKTALQRAAMNALDALNVPLTRAFNALGDRVVIVGKKR